MRNQKWVLFLILTLFSSNGTPVFAEETVYYSIFPNRSFFLTQEDTCKNQLAWRYGFKFKFELQKPDAPPSSPAKSQCIGGSWEDAVKANFGLIYAWPESFAIANTPHPNPPPFGDAKLYQRCRSAFMKYMALCNAAVIVLDGNGFGADTDGMRQAIREGMEKCADDDQVAIQECYRGREDVYGSLLPHPSL